MSDPAYGIDISSWNDIYDWRQVRGNNLTFASVKTTQGTGYRNPKAAGQAGGARDAGVAPGAYHFADNRLPVGAQVNYFVDNSAPLGLFSEGSLMPMLDVEASPGDGIGWNAWSANTFIPQFIRGLRDRTGVADVAIYASLNDWRTILRPDEWADDDVLVWVAVHNGDPGNLQGYYHRRAGLHQHTAEGNVPGAAGFIDRNITVNGFTLSSLLIGHVNPPSPGPAPQPQPTPGGWVSYLVQSGDTLSGIAAARGTSVDELARVNQIRDRNLIYVGQVLMVPAGGGTGGGDGSFPYRIQHGDTLSELAGRFGTSVAAISALNGIADPNLIIAGNWINIPGSNSGGGSPAPAPGSSREPHVVQAGEYLGLIAQRLGVSVDHLVRVNNIANPDLIHPGDRLYY